MRQQHRRDARVVVDHLALGEAGLGIEDLVEVGERQRPPVDLDLHALRRRHGPDARRPSARRGREGPASPTPRRSARCSIRVEGVPCSTPRVAAARMTVHTLEIPGTSRSRRPGRARLARRCPQTPCRARRRPTPRTARTRPSRTTRRRPPPTAQTSPRRIRARGRPASWPARSPPTRLLVRKFLRNIKWREP